MFSGAEYSCNPEAFQQHMVIEQLVAFYLATVFEQINGWCIVVNRPRNKVMFATGCGDQSVLFGPSRRLQRNNLGLWSC